MSNVSMGRRSAGAAFACCLQAVAAILGESSSRFMLFLAHSHINRDVNQHGVHSTVTMRSAWAGRLLQGQTHVHTLSARFRIF